MSKLSSILLVTVQFICIGYFLFMGDMLHLKIVAIILLFLSIIIVTLAVLIMQLDNVSIFPEPKIGVRLKTTGIYKIIRHPMYTSVLFLCLGLLINNFSKVSFIVFIILLIALVIKIFKEEKYLSLQFPGYKEYKKSTQRLIPFIW